MGSSGMMGGYSPTSGQSSPGSLGDVRDWVERWLAARGFEGFRVGEVMTFRNNDYVLVRGREWQAGVRAADWSAGGEPAAGCSDWSRGRARRSGR